MFKRHKRTAAVWIGVALGLAGAAFAGTTAYKYDTLGRVLLSTYPDGSQVGFYYDAAGNRAATRRGKIVPPTTSDRLAAGQGLIPGASITSTSGCFKLTLQEDGNAVITHAGAPIWNSASFAAPSAHLVMQNDGNLVVYGPVGEVYWNAQISGFTGGYVVMQNDGRLVIYQGTTERWSSRSTTVLC